MIDFRHIEEHCLDGLREQMQQTLQDTKFHGEGDVLTHTEMVCAALDVSGLSETNAAELKIAALMHDIGKVRTTQVNGSDITCPNHSVVGARMTREILWKQFGLAGTIEAIQARETIVNLVRYHGFPPHVLEDEFALAKMYRAASISSICISDSSHNEHHVDFNLDMLYRLAKADMQGRICQDQQDALTAVECFRDMAEQEEILFDAPVFNKSYDAYQFLNFKTGDCKDPQLYDDRWGNVFMMVGLPGTGKDAYISRGFMQDAPMISLDNIRQELKLKPGDTNGIVIQTAKERAKEYLRKQQSFVWNATNLTPQRKQLINLFESYKARVFIDYLETTPEEQKRRNHNRDNVVPEETINDMIGKLVLPEFFEAQYVSWNVV